MKVLPFGFECFQSLEGNPEVFSRVLSLGGKSKERKGWEMGGQRAHESAKYINIINFDILFYENYLFILYVLKN